MKTFNRCIVLCLCDLLYTSTRNESCLSRAYENIKASFKTIGQQHSNAFVNNVAVRNKSKQRHGGIV